MPLSVRRGSRAQLALKLPLALLLLSLGAVSTAHASPPARSAYVVGSNDASVTRIDLDSGDVLPNVASVGSLPNRVDVDADGGVFVTANSGGDDVTVFDLVTESVIGPIAVPAGSNPWAVEIVGDRAFVSGLLADAVHVLHLPTGTLVGTLPVGTAPEGMCVAAGKLYVANTGFDFGTFEYGPGSVSVIDPVGLTVLGTVPVSLNPQECLALPDGTVHVVCTGDFFLTEGAIDVVDPATDSVVTSFPVPGYPGGGDVHPTGAVFLNVTTTAFATEIHAYDGTTYAPIFDSTDPLLPSLDFYGNLRATGLGPELLVPNFAQDLLLVENPLAPGTPQAFLVGDGPIDVAVVERESPVPLLLSGLAIRTGPDGVTLSWRASPGADLAGFVVERREGAGPWSRRAELPAARETTWRDTTAAPGRTYSWRVGAIGYAGDVTWSAPLAGSLRAPGTGRLAFRSVRPNPSRAEVTLELALPRAGAVSVEILDVAGRRVTELGVGPRGPGVHEVRWDGRDAAGRPAAPGLYFARVRSGGETAVERVLRLR